MLMVCCYPNFQNVAPDFIVPTGSQLMAMQTHNVTMFVLGRLLVVESFFILYDFVCFQWFSCFFTTGCLISDVSFTNFPVISAKDHIRNLPSTWWGKRKKHGEKKPLWSPAIQYFPGLFLRTDYNLVMCFAMLPSYGRRTLLFKECCLN